MLMGRMALGYSDAPSVPQIALWRIAGDEMVFVAEFDPAEETLTLVESFYQAFITYHQRFSSDYGLGLKGCCWAVDLPQRNIAIEIPELGAGGDGVHGAYVEYLGPDVDLGFRIAKHVRSGEVMVSLQLAKMLARASLQREQGVRFGFVGSAALKGVNFDRPYPLISVTFQNEVDRSSGNAGHIGTEAPKRSFNSVVVRKPSSAATAM